MPGDNRCQTHPHGQADDDAHTASFHQTPHQAGRQHAEHAGEDGQPGIGTDQRLGLRLQGLETPVHYLEMTPGGERQPGQPNRDSGGADDGGDSRRRTNFGAVDPQPGRPRWNRDRGRPLGLPWRFGVWG